MEPFKTLLDIERDCKAYGINIPRHIEVVRDWLGVGFRSSDLNFVCPMNEHSNEISEVLTLPAVTEVPGAHPWFIGIANLRGKILPITDLQGFVTGEIRQQTELSRILVVRQEDAFFGFAVEQVFGIERFYGQEIKLAENLNRALSYLPYAEGAFVRDHKPWIILNFENIIKAAAFYHIIAMKLENA